MSRLRDRYRPFRALSARRIGGVVRQSLARLQHEIRSIAANVVSGLIAAFGSAFTSILRKDVKRASDLVDEDVFAGLALGIGAARYRREGQAVPLRIVPLQLADKVIFGKIRDRFGGRLRIAASGAAPLAADLAEYEAIGMPLIDWWPEGGVTALNPLDMPMHQVVLGKALPGVEFQSRRGRRTADQRPHAFRKGITKTPRRTAELFRDGWLHTGDVRSYMTRRATVHHRPQEGTDCGVNGKKIFPARVETLFKFEPLMDQVVLAGDRLPHLVALFTFESGD